MAAFKYALLFAALVGLASASRLDLNGFTQVPSRSLLQALGLLCTPVNHIV